MDRVFFTCLARSRLRRMILPSMLSTYPTKIASVATGVPALVLFASPGNFASFRVLMVVSVYTGEAGQPIPEFADIPARPQPKDFRKIACEYLKAWAATNMARAGVFALHYDEGGETNWAAVLLGYDVSPRADWPIGVWRNSAPRFPGRETKIRFPVRWAVRS